MEDRCDRCANRIDKGFAGQVGLACALGFVLVSNRTKIILCSECKNDLDASVDSYGETGWDRHRGLVTHLRVIMDGTKPDLPDAAT